MSFSQAAARGGADDEITVGETVAAPEPERPPEFPADFWRKVRGALTAGEFRVLDLYFREGLTHGEIGERLGFTRSNAHQVHHRALEKLRRDRADLAGLLEAA